MDQKAQAAAFDPMADDAVEDSQAIQNHVASVIQSDAFRSSHRSQRFLEHVVSKVLEGRLDDLKERSIGVALFGRSASYDTGQDAIVRVTASDVRKRLLQYYSQVETDIRILLPSGSYMPEFRRHLLPRWLYREISLCARKPSAFPNTQYPHRGGFRHKRRTVGKPARDPD
jgi:hypothetical protein